MVKRQKKIIGNDIPIDKIKALPKLSNKKRTTYKLVILFIIIFIALDIWILVRHIQDDHKRQLFIKNQMLLLGSNNVPSSTKPSTQEIASYQVAPNLPKYLIIPAIHIDSRITKIYASPQNQIEAPNNIYDTGWYTSSSLPGQPGAMFMDGHVSSWTANGVFYNLKQLRPNDVIQVVRGDNKTFTYVVEKLQVYDANNVDMGQALASIESNSPGLNIMTCTGSVISGTSEFNERLVVYSVLKS